MLIAACVWACALVYSVGVCVAFGYGRSAESLKFIFGLPDWIFWGVMLPWGCCTLFAVTFGLFVMQDFELEEGLHVDDLRETDDNGDVGRVSNPSDGSDAGPAGRIENPSHGEADDV
jgi:hypothetical protein